MTILKTVRTLQPTKCRIQQNQEATGSQLLKKSGARIRQKSKKQTFAST
uniref:Uncharacterized protein n=1 Tax=Arundo donax TaxID=35708 RepID=A0A0A8Z2I5_ARUDO